MGRRSSHVPKRARPRARGSLWCVASLACAMGIHCTEGVGGAGPEGSDAGGAGDTRPDAAAADAVDAWSEPLGEPARVSLDDALGFTADFRRFLQEHGYAELDFPRTDLGVPNAYGGRVRAEDAVARDPVVFVHGNSDRGVDGPLGGFRASLLGFRAQAYAPHELYAFTWGAADERRAARQTHAREHVLRVRRFLEAVLAYTGARHIDVVAHSMGVTLARAAIAGTGLPDGSGGTYDVGAPLTERIDVFLAIAGANLGLSSCYAAAATPTCNAEDGFYPGTRVGTGPVVGRSRFLDALLARPSVEGAHRYVIYSPGDRILGPGALVWGEVTARLPNQDRELVLDSALDHLDTRDAHIGMQIAFVRDHGQL